MQSGRFPAAAALGAAASLEVEGGSQAEDLLRGLCCNCYDGSMKEREKRPKKGIDDGSEILRSLITGRPAGVADELAKVVRA